MKEIIEELRPEYNLTNRAGKTEITERIVRTIQSEGGRFLRSYHPKGAKKEFWTEESFESARQKVGHTIRDSKHGKEKNRSSAVAGSDA